jgi:hypothetical protein
MNMQFFASFLLLCYLFVIVYCDGNNPMSAPAAGEVIEAEKPFEIQWSSGTPGPVKIELRFADTTAVLITSTTPNNGTYMWIPSGVLAGKDNYFMVICDLTVNDCTYTFNGRFAIEEAGGSSSSAATLDLTSSASNKSVLPCAELSHASYIS